MCGRRIVDNKFAQIQLLFCVCTQAGRETLPENDSSDNQANNSVGDSEFTKSMH